MNNRNPAQRLYLALHRRTFESRLKRQRRFPGKYVISLGNLSAGGTGKTPAALWLAQRTLERRPLVVLRGYRGKTGRRGALVSDGENIQVNWRRAGDEALLLASLKGLRVAAGPSRGELIADYGAESEIILLDDAFQNPSVYRDHDLVLMDAAVDSDRVQVFPTGIFREDCEALSRADSLLFTRVDQAPPGNLAKLRRAVAPYLPEERIFSSIHDVEGLFQLNGERLPARAAEDLRLGAFCGIGHPSAFYHTLRGAGYVIRRCVSFPDHHPFRANEMRRLARLSEREGLSWVTTEKDAIRLRNREDLPGEWLASLLVLKIRLRILEEREEDLLTTVLSGPRADKTYMQLLTGCTR